MRRTQIARFELLTVSYDETTTTVVEFLMIPRIIKTDKLTLLKLTTVNKMNGEDSLILNVP